MRASASSTRPEWTQATEAPRGSAMDQYRDLGMREYLNGLAAEDDRGDAVAAVRGHDDKVAAFRPRGIDDRLVGMLMLDMDHLAGDACCLRCLGDGAESFLSMRLHAYFVLSRRVLEHPRVGREHMKGRQDRQRGGFRADPLGQGDAVLDGLPSEFRPVRRYQDVGIHRSLLGSHFASRSRIDSNSCRRSVLVVGLVISSPSSVSRTIRETISRAFSLSSAGTTYQGASRMLVALRHSSYAFIYCSQNFRSSTSARLNFQFFSGSSMRCRKRFRCSSFDRWR